MQTVQERYQYKPFPGSSHSWALKEIQSINKDVKILDIGPGSGLIGDNLAKLGLTELYAVEIDEKTREILAPIYKDIKPDISDLNESGFDYVFLLDVLEHMTTPFEYFKELKKYLNPNAVIYISVPNIAHWSTRFGLLFGLFEYTNRGLLDRTHYNFFNKRRTKEFAKTDDAYKLISYQVTSSPIEYFLPESIWSSSFYKTFSNIRKTFINCFPGLFGYQHLLKIECKK